VNIVQNTAPQPDDRGRINRVRVVGCLPDRPGDAGLSDQLGPDFRARDAQLAEQCSIIMLTRMEGSALGGRDVWATRKVRARSRSWSSRRSGVVGSTRSLSAGSVSAQGGLSPTHPQWLTGPGGPPWTPTRRGRTNFGCRGNFPTDGSHPGPGGRFPAEYRRSAGVGRIGVGALDRQLHHLPRLRGRQYPYQLAGVHVHGDGRAGGAGVRG
jgi:hypothetical protein